MIEGFFFLRSFSSKYKIYSSHSNQIRELIKFYGKNILVMISYLVERRRKKKFRVPIFSSLLNYDYSQ